MKERVLVEYNFGHIQRVAWPAALGRKDFILLDPAETGFVETVIQPQDGLHLIKEAGIGFRAADRSASWPRLV